MTTAAGVEQAWALAIGAGREQAAAIHRTQDLGHRVIALDGDPDAPCLTTADKALVVDVTDVDAVVHAVEDLDIAFVVPAPMGRLLSVVGALNERLGLPGISAEAADRCTDKARFDEVVRNAGGRRPAHVEVHDRTELRSAVAETGLPCVVKPSTGSGSRGVVVCRQPGDLDRSVTPIPGDTGPWVVEALVDGREVGVDAFVLDGEAHVLLVRDKVMSPLPHRQELGYVAPSEIDPATLRAELQTCVDAIGLDHCVLHADVIIGPTGPVVVEMAGRPAGLLVAEQLVGFSTGVDPFDLAVLLLVSPDQVPSWVAARRHPVPRAVALRFWDSPAGLVGHVPEVGLLDAQPGVAHVALWASPGDRLVEVTCGTDVLARGVVVTTGASPRAAASRAAEVVANHPIVVDKEPP